MLGELTIQAGRVLAQNPGWPGFTRGGVPAVQKAGRHEHPRSAFVQKFMEDFSSATNSTQRAIRRSPDRYQIRSALKNAGRERPVPD